MHNAPPPLSIGRRAAVLASTMLVGALAAAAAGSVRAEALVGLTTGNALVRFDSASPGMLGALVPITGLQAGDALLGFDRRPTTTAANGALYGLARGSDGSGRLYTINDFTGAATLASTLSVALSGQNVGIDFNPVVDRLRVVTDSGQNLRINVDTGATTVDTALAYAATDANAGTSPQVVGAAYSNNVGGATTTALRVLDAGTDALLLQAPPNAGTLNTLGSLGAAFGVEAGFDVSGLTGIAYATLARIGVSGSELYRIGANGAATLLGAVGGGDGLLLRDVAAPVAKIPVPATAALLVVGLLAGAASRRRRA